MLVQGLAHNGETLNKYKMAWQTHADSIIPPITKSVDDSSTSKTDSVKLGSAIGKTARAAAIAIAMSQADGPLPFADVVAFAYFSVSAATTWHDYFS